LEQARGWANQVLEEIRPYCLRAEIAGSIRRGRPVVGDIDFVVEAIPARLAELRGRIMKDKQVLIAGDLNLAVLAGRIQLDFFCATPTEKELFDVRPGNWGTLLLCRTGSREFNAWLANRANARGMHWNPYWGLVQGGKIIACETEAAIFAALDLPEIPPAAREVGIEEVANPIIERFKQG
jgi:DNA polymerase/3'-5' exonuclease PolX